MLDELEAGGQIAYRYADGHNSNGSVRDIAGVRNARGNVVGLMPHPEHAVDPLTGSTDGRAVFEALEGFGAVERRGDVVAVFPQGVAEQRLDRLLVVDEEDAGGPVGHVQRVVGRQPHPYRRILDALQRNLGRMCEYRVLRSQQGPPIITLMQQQELKSLVDSGRYKPDPSRIAAAMLRRRGVRELLTGAYATHAAAGRSPGAPGLHHRAA